MGPAVDFRRLARSDGALPVHPGARRLTQGHIDLKDGFYQRIRERGAENGDEARLRATIVRLRRTIAAKNKELAQLRADVPALARARRQLTLKITSSAT